MINERTNVHGSPTMKQPNGITGDWVSSVCKEEPFDQAVELLNDLTPHQLYRLSARIDLFMEDSTRLKPIARSLSPGCEIEYFCSRENRCIPAIVNKVNRTTADVTNVGDGKRWRIELAAINTGGAEDSLQSMTLNRPLAREDLSVGQLVGFSDRDDQDTYGVIVRLNQKTVTLECDFGKMWRVSYGLLFPVLDGQAAKYHSNDNQPRITDDNRSGRY